MTTIDISSTAAPITIKAVLTPHPSLSILPRSALPDLAVTSRMTHQKPPRVATEAGTLASMRQCPKFDSCSAPICPLDPNWTCRGMTTSDSVCGWFREIAKAGPEAQGVPEELRSQVAAVYQTIVTFVGLAPLRAALKQAARTGSQRDPARIARMRSLVFKKGN